jgi:hypothetical protein
MGKVSRPFVVILATVVIAVASLAGTSFADSSASKTAKKKAAIATLAVENPNVSVKKKGSDTFVPATNGQKLRQGDTVQTDATGRATVNYTDSAYTRLDVSTTFTIEKLTQDKGARQIKGSLDTGRTWNRTEALTESGSFEQSGAGATAAVVGTAFSMECKLLPNPDPSALPEKECSFLGVFHQIILKSDGTSEVRDVPENGLCTSTQPTETSAGDLCDAVHELTPDEMAAITWIQENLLRDLTEHNFGPGPILTSFNVVVENGQIVAVTQNPPPTPLPITSASSSSSSSSSSSTTTTTTTTTTTVPPPSINSPKVNISGGGSNANPTPYTVPSGNQDGLVTEDETTVADDNLITFTINVTGPAGHTLKVKFTQLAGGTYGAIQWKDDSNVWHAVLQTDVDNETLFPDSTEFRFLPEQYEPVSDCQTATTAVPENFASCYANYPATVTNNLDGTVSWSTAFKVVAVDETSGKTSDEASIPITIVDDICTEIPNRVACDLITTTTEDGGGGGGFALATVTTDEPQTSATTAATEPPTSADTTPPTAADTAPPTSEDTTTTTSGSDG